MEDRLTHFDASGNAVMVDVSEKAVTTRIAEARGRIQVNQAVYDAISNGTAKKGDVLGVARIAGIMGAKKTSDLIPMCHPLMISKCTVDFTMHPETLSIEACCIVKVSGQTGVEMEALTGVNLALLTIYDMCKAMDKGMEITNVRLIEKQGGKSGHYKREEA
ncbi:MAG: cyclic pyranopterin monophosphate synthase MoaC [Clostridiales bacterium]|uniref:cyclic pyranopterin monophosphate synthase MoaC n=1 Tax=Zhenhengia sp. TaxID=2944208 RepID=UPI002910CB13|nr:cyclic pyranopterin monophosphate synthase MoaC [Clostridiales bacterium]MDU6853135.1 cyclic pyranopterin monophosphate synthase MoaC [Clostridiales bacterium]MDU6972731.1 cyclic pyranopterin monophosphate synthase MoaC [Clostridiales bacterium]